MNTNISHSALSEAERERERERERESEREREFFPPKDSFESILVISKNARETD